jgi:hypothetical protein
MSQDLPLTTQSSFKWEAVSIQLGFLTTYHPQEREQIFSPSTDHYLFLAALSSGCQELGQIEILVTSSSFTTGKFFFGIGIQGFNRHISASIHLSLEPLTSKQLKKVTKS